MGCKTLLQRVPRNLMTAYIAVRRFRPPAASAFAGGRTFKEQPQASRAKSTRGATDLAAVGTDVTEA